MLQQHVMVPDDSSRSDLRSIVYVSTAVRPMTSAGLEALLHEARRLNEANGVTGLLIYRDGKFLQCFEGSESAVAITYDRILGSRQHHDVIELLNAPMSCRSFADWRMAFATPTAEEMRKVRATSWARTSQEVATRWSDAVGLSVLRDFWQSLWQQRAPQPAP